MLSWLADDPSRSLVAYSPLLKGAYTRDDKPLPESFDHPGTPARLAVLDEVARQTGATRNQVVIAWMLGAPVPAIPLVGASSVAQLDESIEAVDLELTAEQQGLPTASANGSGEPAGASARGGRPQWQVSASPR